MAIHVGIIDKDPIRLVTPLLDNRTISNHIVFIGVKAQEEIYTRLHNVLAKRQITSEFFEIPNVANPTKIKQSICALAKDLKQRAEDVKLNASCGLRHRLLSVYEIFRSYHWPIFVVEPSSDRLCWLYPDGKEDTQVQDRITIDDYLTIFGARGEFSEHEISPNSTNSFMNLASAGQATHWNSVQV